MLSRGALGLASPRVRRGMALSWSALFILSLLLQYASFALAPSALAVHDGNFQLDGDATDNGAGNDWDSLGSPDASVFVHEAPNATIFTTGGSKDDLNTTSWRWTNGSVPDKDDLLDGFAAIYGDVLYFGADRYANNGDSAIGFWFFQNGLNVNANGTFSPAHAIGDLFVVSHFENGGASSEIQLYSWVGSGGSDGALDLVATGQVCTAAPAADKACGIANQDDVDAPWAYTPKDGDAGTFPQFSFFEGGLDLAQVFEGSVPCFGSFLVETRSSQEVNAQLKDFIAGDFNTCVPPTIATQVRQGGQSLGSVGTISLGDTVTDHATFSGSDGAVTGTADFFVCFNAASTPSCASGGTAAGSDTISAGAADSDAFTPTQVGYYCFRVVYTPDQASQYLAGSHTNQTTECFQVLPANVTIDKTADDGSVSAGDQIGFILSWGNSGAGKATGVVVTDELPGNAGLNWSIAGSTGTGSTCSIAGAVGSQVLTCNVGSINGNTAVSGTVHVVSDTTEASCGTIDNTGAIESGNDGAGEASASVIVVCPESLFIDKTLADTGATDPDLGVPLAEIGDTLHYTLAYAGAGPITNAVITDVLPVGLEYVAGSAAGDANFTFDSYDPTTRTLTWTAATLPSPASGSVTYDALVLATAPDQPQPLVNVATIVSDRTPPDSDQESVAVLAPPEALTPPPTDVFTPATGSANPGFALMVILLAIAGLTIAIGFVTPVPAKASRRTDRRR